MGVNQVKGIVGKWQVFAVSDLESALEPLLAEVRPRQLDQVPDRAYWKRGVDHQQARGGRRHGDRCEVLQWIVRQLAVKARGDPERASGQQ